MAILPETTPQLSIIILNYGTDDLVRALIKKLGSSPQTEIIVVDNSPQPSLAKSLAGHAHITYVFPGKNLGFAGGNNLGIRQARGEWVMLLNSDTETTLTEIHGLIDACERSHHTVAAPRLHHGSAVERNVGVFDSFLTHPVNWLFARPRYLHAEQLTEPTEVDFATGAALLVHRTVFDAIGYLDDTTYFMYFEDLDFCQRLYSYGIGILYVPAIDIVHLGGQSSNQDMSRKNRNYQSGLQAYLRKHRGRVITAVNRICKFLR